MTPNRRKTFKLNVRKISIEEDGLVLTTISTIYYFTFNAVVEGLIWRFGKKVGASTFFRGIRSWEKDGMDERSLHILNTWGPLLLGPTWPIPTIYLEGDPQYNHVSSTLIRTICTSKDTSDKAKEEKLSELVPHSVAKLVMDLYGKTDQS
jgi:phosphopantetheine adenylyltransferase